MPGSSLSRHLESGVDPGNEVGGMVMKGGELQRKNSLFKFLVCHVMLKVHT